MKLHGFFLLFLGVQKNLIGAVMCSRRNANFKLPPMRKNFSNNKIHYGLRKGNKKIITFATINNN